MPADPTDHLRSAFAKPMQRRVGVADCLGFI